MRKARHSELLSQHSVPLLHWEISQCKKVPIHLLNLNIAKDLMNQDALNELSQRAIIALGKL